MSEMNPMAEAPLRITTRITLKLKRRPGHKTLMEGLELAGENTHGYSNDYGINVPLLQGLTRAFYWQRLLDSGEVRSGSEIAKLEGLNPSTVNELLRITLLDPSLIQTILKGTSPQGLSMVWLTRNSLSDFWNEQFKSCS